MSRYARQEILLEVGATGQARLASARVLVVGAGGLGATLIPALAGAGVGQIRIADPDRVEEGNLHRQTLYRMADIGEPKAACAAREAMALNPHVRAEALLTRFDPDTAGALLAGADLALDAADSHAATYTLSDACAARGLPMISASVLGLAGHVGGFCGGGPSYRALFPDLPQSGATCATAGVLGPVVAGLAAMQAQMALAVLLGLTPSPLGQLIRIDLRNWRLSQFRFDAAPEPERRFPFIGADAVTPTDQVVELRDAAEAPTPAIPGARRIAPGALAGWQPAPGRVVLCCRSGLRAWRAAEALAKRGHQDLALLAAG